MKTNIDENYADISASAIVNKTYILNVHDSMWISLSETPLLAFWGQGHVLFD